MLTPVNVLAPEASVASLPAASLMDPPLVLMAFAASTTLVAASLATTVYSKVRVVVPVPLE